MKRYLSPVWVLLACGPALVEPINPQPLDPGPAQVAAAAHVTTCSGIQVQAGDVRWWVAEGIRHHPDALGAWNHPRDIYLLPAAVDSELVSGHELLHHVLRGDHRHRSPLWERCGFTLEAWLAASGAGP